MQYAYRNDFTASFEETLSLTEKLVTLRGEDERFGAVLKGLVCLDWERFEHFSKPYVMGEYPKEFIRQRTSLKASLWKNVTAGWLRNAELARKTVSLVAQKGDAPILEMLVEDGIFENEIPFPVALLAEMLWDPDRDTDAMLEEVAKYPFISL